MCFALAMKIPRYDVLLKRGSQHVSELLAMTTAVVMYKVFVHGGLTTQVLRLLKIPMGSEVVCRASVLLGLQGPTFR